MILRQIRELESRFKDTYTQSLTMKDERIQVLEERVDEITADNSQLREEIAALKSKNEKLTQIAAQSSRRASTGGSPAHIHGMRWGQCTRPTSLLPLSLSLSLSPFLPINVVYHSFWLHFPTYSRTYSPREINRLKEQAADSLRLRDRLHRLQEEVSDSSGQHTLSPTAQ